LLGVELAPGTPILPIIASIFCSMVEGLLASFGPQAVRQAAVKIRPRLRPMRCRLARGLLPATRKPT
jgi:hypothetical protein